MNRNKNLSKFYKVKEQSKFMATNIDKELDKLENKQQELTQRNNDKYNLQKVQEMQQFLLKIGPSNASELIQ